MDKRKSPLEIATMASLLMGMSGGFPSINAGPRAGTGYCKCGKRISENKTHCLACAERLQKEQADA